MSRNLTVTPPAARARTEAPPHLLRVIENLSPDSQARFRAAFDEDAYWGEHDRIDTEFTGPRRELELGFHDAEAAVEAARVMRETGVWMPGPIGRDPASGRPTGGVYDLVPGGAFTFGPNAPRPNDFRNLVERVIYGSTKADPDPRRGNTLGHGGSSEAALKLLGEMDFEGGVFGSTEEITGLLKTMRDGVRGAFDLTCENE